MPGFRSIVTATLLLFAQQALAQVICAPHPTPTYRYCGFNPRISAYAECCYATFGGAEAYVKHDPRAIDQRQFLREYPANSSFVPGTDQKSFINFVTPLHPPKDKIVTVFRAATGIPAQAPTTWVPDPEHVIPELLPFLEIPGRHTESEIIADIDFKDSQEEPGELTAPNTPTMPPATG